MATAVQNRGSWDVQIVTVTAAGTPVQGPDLKVPHGFALAIYQRHHAGGSPIGYVAPSSAKAGATGTRKELRDGEGFTLLITNANLLYFDADTNTTIFEVFVEQA